MNQTESSNTDNKVPFLKMWVTVPVAFLILASVILFIFLSRGDFQRDQVTINIDSPFTIDAGSEELVEVILNNNSKVSIQDVRIAVHLPPEIVFDDDSRSKIFQLDSLESKDEHRIPLRISAVSAGGSVELDARVDYSPKDINARFSDAIKREILIGSLSVDVVLDIPDEIYSTETVNGSVNITPRASFDKETLYARILSDDGFEIKESVQEFARDNSWRLNNLEEGETQTIEFMGDWTGVTDNFVLEFEIGKYEGLDFITLLKLEKQVTITSSPMILVVEKQNDESIKSGSEVVLDIAIQNKGDEPISNVKLNADLPILFLEERTATGGFGSRVSNNVVTWSYEHIEELKNIDSQSEIKIKLEFRVKDFDKIVGAYDDQGIKVLFNAEAVIDGRGSLYQSLDKNLEITGEPKFTQTVLRESSNFPAEGPFPLEVGEETSFVVRWHIRNNINKLSNIQVSTILPEHVDYGGSTYPISRDIFYDENQKKIVWEVQSLDKFATKDISYIIWAVPRASQEGSFIQLLGESNFKAFDPVLKDFMDKKLLEVDSSLPDDRTIENEDGLVVD